MGYLRRLTVASAATALAALAFATVAPASTYNPTGEWAPFGECPLASPTVEYCFDTGLDGGSLKLGTKTVPISKPPTLQGGVEGSPFEFLAAENTQTLTKAPQPIPGGLLGVTAPTSWPPAVQEWFNEGIENGLTGVTLTIELAGPASSIALDLENLLLEEGVALGLPLRFHLENALLGSECFIASNSEPVPMHLTTGNSGGLNGLAGTLTFNGGFTLTSVENTDLVDNTFATPEASGCGGIFSTYVDPLVNSILGLPAGSGKNWLILGGDLRLGDPLEVFANAM